MRRSTRATRPRELPSSVRAALEGHGFVLEKDVALGGAALFRHPLTGDMRVRVSMSHGQGDLVTWQFVHVPTHLLGVLVGSVQAADVDDFDRHMLVAGAAIEHRYRQGPRVAFQPDVGDY